MFSYTGLTPEQVAAVQNDSHVYILKTGRISIAGCKFALYFARFLINVAW
jgi:aspartate aminotransferase